ncbi:hypothetical protein BST97_05305 [Nonlabens spongiae]|uniref:Uncharacterized protein n=1 Tax=Nonlabens spongiae TaxID=331648 RepID=A0A1W6MIQ0_9FLAO|nr:hypothetical protein [Nonlabens spongiae]ARN77447.1 hypothetical protein BST97_05305 [Nonlabens spongiae]
MFTNHNSTITDGEEFQPNNLNIDSKISLLLVAIYALLSSCSEENNLKSISQDFEDNRDCFESVLEFIESKYIPVYLENNYSRLVIHPSKAKIKARGNIRYDKILDSLFKNYKLQTIKISNSYCNSNEDLQINFTFSSNFVWKHDYFVIYRSCDKYTEASGENNSYSYLNIDENWTIEEDRNSLF